METKNIVGVTIAITVSIICIASLLVPVIGAAQEIAEPTSVTNEGYVVLREAEDGDILKCEREVILEGTTYSDTWFLNGEEILTTNGVVISNNVGLISDGLYMQIQSKTTTAGMFYNMSTSSPTAGYFGASSSSATGTVESTTFTFDSGNIEVLTNSGNTLSIPYTWGYVACNPEDGEVIAVSGGVGYVSDSSEVILCGAYTSGDLDTMYYYKDGTAYTSNSSYSATVDVETELADGYTDIYSATVSVEVTDGSDTETFTPYRVILPYVVDGHATGGIVYSLYGVIPIVVLIAVLMMAVYTVPRVKE